MEEKKIFKYQWGGLVGVASECSGFIEEVNNDPIIKKFTDFFKQIEQVTNLYDLFTLVTRTSFPKEEVDRINSPLYDFLVKCFQDATQYRGNDLQMNTAEGCELIYNLLPVEERESYVENVLTRGWSNSVFEKFEWAVSKISKPELEKAARRLISGRIDRDKLQFLELLGDFPYHIIHGLSNAEINQYLVEHKGVVTSGTLQNVVLAMKTEVVVQFEYFFKIYQPTPNEAYDIIHWLVRLGNRTENHLKILKLLVPLARLKREILCHFSNNISGTEVEFEMFKFLFENSTGEEDLDSLLGSYFSNGIRSLPVIEFLEAKGARLKNVRMIGAKDLDQVQFQIRYLEKYELLTQQHIQNLFEGCVGAKFEICEYLLSRYGKEYFTPIYLPEKGFQGRNTWMLSKAFLEKYDLFTDRSIVEVSDDE
jgi:hypothetical protein